MTCIDEGVDVSIKGKMRRRVKKMLKQARLSEVTYNKQLIGHVLDRAYCQNFVLDVLHA